MLLEKIESLLNDQVQHEFEAGNWYLAMSSWAEVNGFHGTANFFLEQSKEEQFHAMKIFHYINDRDGHAVAPAITKPDSEFDSIRHLFERGLELEQENTRKIDNLVEAAKDAKDNATHQFLQWYVDEQVEEEELFRTILDKLNILGEKGPGLYMLDKELGQRQADLPENGNAEETD
ncbi:MAG: ferritin [Bacteroidetes bacterium]|jgi:ferritin|nr:ferritin [Bacteroidota bacterium]